MDWLITPVAYKAKAYRESSSGNIVLSNGLICRTLSLTGEVATVGFSNLMTRSSIIRGLKPEAMLTLDGTEYALADACFKVTGFKTGAPSARLIWTRKRHSANLPWPPRGAAVTIDYQCKLERYQGLIVSAHYEIYDGIPVLCKWISLTNSSTRTVTLDNVTTEMLALTEPTLAPMTLGNTPSQYLFSEYSFFGTSAMDRANRTVVSSAASADGLTPPITLSRYPIGPWVELAPGGSFETFRTFVMPYDSNDLERRSLFVRRSLRILAPWATENPTMLHLTKSDSTHFRAAVDQCAKVGFEMIVFSFLSGIDMENENPAYVSRIKADVDYAHSRGIQVGTYSLLASRHISNEDDVIDPASGRTDRGLFGSSPCLGSRWGQNYLRKMTNFIAQTGIDMFEHDGSYPGDLCASHFHPGHRGTNDSQWQQWKAMTQVYGWCRARGVYLAIPDFYFLAGSSKTFMNYSEGNLTRPCDEQVLIARQDAYHGTFGKIPTMGWTFVPLEPYGNGASGGLEPLRVNLQTYEAQLSGNFAAGVQAAYRGARLYDTDATKAMVQKWVSWFKRYRNILESDIIHVRPPDGKDIDAILHVNPQLGIRGLAVVHNPTDQYLERTLKLPLYYTGLTNKAFLREQESRGIRVDLDHNSEVEISVKLLPRSLSWWTIQYPNIIETRTNTRPVLVPVPDPTIQAHDNINLRVCAFDRDLPTNRLTFSLDAGFPVGARIDPATGIFQWTPDDVPASVTNSIVVRVTDDGHPG